MENLFEGSIFNATWWKLIIYLQLVPLYAEGSPKLSVRFTIKAQVVEHHLNADRKRVSCDGDEVSDFTIKMSKNILN